MPKRKRKDQGQVKEDAHPYDSLFKHIFRKEANIVVPVLVPGAEILEDLNVEIDRSTLRGDLALKSRLEGDECIIHFEEQTDDDPEIEQRISIYNSGLHFAYGLPVVSVLFRPFYTTVTIKTPYQVMCGKRVCSTCHIVVIDLWKEDPQKYLDGDAVPLFIFLPGMNHPSVAQLKQAIKRIADYYGSQRCGERLAQFRVILGKTTMVSPEAKEEIEKELAMYTPYQIFMRENPDFQQQVAIAKLEGVLEGELKGKLEGELKGKLEGQKISTLNFLNSRFPNDTIVELIKQAIVRVDDPKTAEKLQLETFLATDPKNLLEKVSQYVSPSITVAKKEDEVEEGIRNNIREFLLGLEISTELLTPISQLLSSIPDAKELLRIQKDLFPLEDEEDLQNWLNAYLSQDQEGDDLKKSASQTEIV